jgi:hypothetical protein
MWYNNYYVINNSDNKKLQIYIDKLTKSTNNNIDSKVDQLEWEYESKLNELKSLCNDSELLSNIKTNYSLIILQKELEIIKLLTKYSLLNNTLDYIFFLQSLNILLYLSETLRLRLEQKEIILDKNKGDIIKRCSYKFCSYKDNCTYNYNHKIKNQCYQDHYVHNMVSLDIKILIKYITSKYDSKTNINHTKDILKTINTLSFVINHMESELKMKCMYLPKEEWDKCHIIKNK